MTISHSSATVWELGFTVENQRVKIVDFGIWVRCAKSPVWSGRDMETFGGGENGTTRANVTLMSTLFDCGPPKALEYDVLFKGMYLARVFKAVCKNMTAELHASDRRRFVVGRPRSCPLTDEDLSHMPVTKDLEIERAFKDLMATNWDELPSEIVHGVKNALSKNAEDKAAQDVLKNVFRAAEANVKTLSEEYSKALQTIFDSIVYLAAFGPEESYLKKKVETELGTKMICLKMWCGGLEAKWGKIKDFSIWVRCAKSPDWWGREMGTFGGGENGTTRVNVTLMSTLFDCGPAVEMKKALEYDVMFKGRYRERAIKAVCKNMTAEPHGSRGFTVEKQNDKIGDFGVWVRCAKSPDWSGREMGTFGLRENGNARVNVTLSTMLFDCGPVEMKALEYDVMFKGRYLDYEFKAVCKNMTAAEAHGGRGGSFMVGPPKSCRVNDYKPEKVLFDRVPVEMKALDYDVMFKGSYCRYELKAVCKNMTALGSGRGGFMVGRPRSCLVTEYKEPQRADERLA
ncbi:succinate dehydrogenase 5 [Striga asiatica]|uniref:Succinate dehydrogenase 5 n=1 Tax=Striga asiatica TaxID=4170 RepID=A0A5A7R976_STRAF|nr:succinate dehydrogenase 5 [Striga asiatica]